MLTRDGAIDPRLRLTDRLLLRWGATPTAELPVATRSLLAPLPVRSTYVALPDAECELVDKTVRGSPPWAKGFALLWYRLEASTEELAKALKIARRQAIYEERRLVLAYFLGRFVELRVNRPGWPRS